MDATFTQAVLALSGIVGSGALWAGLKVFIDFVTKNREYKGAKVNAWRHLLEGQRWKTAAPALLESTFADAHGYLLGDREIRFGLSRHNTTEFFLRLSRCRVMLEVNAEGLGLTHRRGLKFARWDYRVHGIGAMVAACVPLLGLAPLAKLLAHVLEPAVVGWLFVLSGAWFFFHFLAAQRYEAAHVVVSRLDRFFPAWSDSQSVFAPAPGSRSVTPIRGRNVGGEDRDLAAGG
ncbi:hypothetical protein FHW69_001355 [Luteibacter sp. Sphag1AF]|uniref:hypothetical protein n=1 Tax=Luteibacter sp. Sphag1AF TaxID=2587031 RepID=UPI001609FEEC|nr:hypothetical protein [Luteibacter sp. Sphag1AF]MBB3226765.1 hypothetical protein [Luteibacter sp. Sphag1AF]